MADNIFNTFSFTKWTERLREQKMEEEIQKQRMEQVARLRNKLGQERNLREQADMLNDDDIDQLIRYLNEGGLLTNPGLGVVPTTTIVTTNIPPPQRNNTDITLFGQMPRPPKSDAYIMNEIKNYSKKKNISTIPETIFNYNRRHAEMLIDRAQTALQNPRSIDPSKLKIYEFEYNRRNNLV